MSKSFASIELQPVPDAHDLLDLVHQPARAARPGSGTTAIDQEPLQQSPRIRGGVEHLVVGRRRDDREVVRVAAERARPLAQHADDRELVGPMPDLLADRIEPLGNSVSPGV